MRSLESVGIVAWWQSGSRKPADAAQQRTGFPHRLSSERASASESDGITRQEAEPLDSLEGGRGRLRAVKWHGRPTESGRDGGCRLNPRSRTIPALSGPHWYLCGADSVTEGPFSGGWIRLLSCRVDSGRRLTNGQLQLTHSLTSCSRSLRKT